VSSDEAPVTRESLGHLVAIVSPVVIPPPRRVWKTADWSRIRSGHRALDMDDKWHAFVEGDRLYLHRSWTGRGAYQAEFTRGNSGWRIVHARAESNPSSRNPRGAEADSLGLELVIESVLLNRFHEQDWRRWQALVEANAGQAFEFGVWLHNIVGNRWGEVTP
jgi:hypothetical protein